MIHLLTALILFSSPIPPSEHDPLAEGFRNPPARSRMRMFWRIFGPSWEPKEIDYQLDLLKSAGIGGVTAFFFYPVALDDPARGIKNEPYLSPAFLKTLKYASQAAKRRGIRFSVSGGTGWPFGGPSVKLEDAAQRIRREVIQPESDGTFRVPALKPGERVVAAFIRGLNVTPMIRGEHIRIPNEMPERHSSTLNTQLSKLNLYVSGPTNMRVKRPALGGEGLVVSHYDWGAAKKYLESAVLPMIRQGGIESIFCDSLEVYNSNWTPDLPAEFRKRRGYELIPNLDKLFDGDPDVRFDFWRTLAELTEERFTKPVAEWCHKHGVKLEMEAYGTPPNPLTAAQYIDTPCGEQYEWKGFSFSRWAASGGHLAGKRIISAEAWTWLGIPNRMADSLSDFKLASDMHFLAGINDLLGVDFPYSPRSVPAPGWIPYYGPFMNQNNPQWPYFHAFVDYVNRCQWMLRQGKPVTHVAVYLPVEDKLATGPLEQMPLNFLIRDHFVTGKPTGEFSLVNARKHHSNLLHGLLERGFSFDGVDFWTLVRKATVSDGKLVCGDGEYSVLILPNLIGVDLHALKKIAEFCNEGGTVVAIGRPPDRMYGEQRDPEYGMFRSLVSGLFGQAEIQGRWHRFGKGAVVSISDEEMADQYWLRELDSSKDFPEAMLSRSDPFNPEKDEEYRLSQTTFAHRQTADADIYFVASLSDEPGWVHCSFRTSRRYPSASYWDPVRGLILALKTKSDRESWNHGFSHDLSIYLPPRASGFVVLSKRPFTAGAPVQTDMLRRRVVLPDRGGWSVSFEGPDPPAVRTIHDLDSWTKWPESRFFSGQAAYSTEFEWSGPAPKRSFIRLGEVHEAAEVRVNGKKAGVAWCPPFEVDVTGLIHSGRNTLEITVGNLSVNRFLGLPDEDLRPLRAAYGNRFPDPEEKRVMKEPAPSGLLGPVELLYSK